MGLLAFAAAVYRLRHIAKDRLDSPVLFHRRIYPTSNIRIFLSKGLGFELLFADVACAFQWNGDISCRFATVAGAI